MGDTLENLQPAAQEPTPAPLNYHRSGAAALPWSWPAIVGGLLSIFSLFVSVVAARTVEAFFPQLLLWNKVILLTPLVLGFLLCVTGLVQIFLHGGRMRGTPMAIVGLLACGGWASLLYVLQGLGGGLN